MERNRMMEEAKEISKLLAPQMKVFADKHDLSLMHLLGSVYDASTQLGLEPLEAWELVEETLTDTVQRMEFKALCVNTIPNIFIDAFEDFKNTQENK